jgi:hypothetical protein
VWVWVMLGCAGLAVGWYAFRGRRA